MKKDALSSIQIMRYTFVSFFGLFLSSCSLFSSNNEEMDRTITNEKPIISGENVKPFKLGEYKEPHQEAGSIEDYKNKFAEEDKDIVFTDADDPDKELAALDKIFSVSSYKDWTDDYVEAKKRAVQEQKPILIWFTDSKRSPNSQKLGDEVMGETKFGDWSMKNLVKLKLDAVISVKDSDKRVRKEKVLRELQKKYQVAGFPHIVILTADGQVVEKWGGYKPGTFESVRKRIVNSAIVADNQFKETKKSLMAQGYRDWVGKNGIILFARLFKYEENGELLMQLPDGSFVRTSLRSLDGKDIQWIEEQRQKSRSAR